jgi:hypothetical protein
MPSSAGNAARNLPPRDHFYMVGLDDDDEEEAEEEPHAIYDEPLPVSTQPRAGSHHPAPSQHAVVHSRDGHHSDNVDLLAGLRDNEGRFDHNAADDDGAGAGSHGVAGTEPEDEPEPTQRIATRLVGSSQPSESTTTTLPLHAERAAPRCQIKTSFNSHRERHSLPTPSSFDNFNVMFRRPRTQVRSSPQAPLRTRADGYRTRIMGPYHQVGPY